MQLSVGVLVGARLGLESSFLSFCSLKIPMTVALSHNLFCSCCTRSSWQQFSALTSVEGFPGSDEGLQDGQRNICVCVYMHTGKRKDLSFSSYNQLM